MRNFVQSTRILCVTIAAAFLMAMVMAGGMPRAADLAIEKPAALSGYGYTVLGNLFVGNGGNLSYLRFLNLSGSVATVSATLVGSPSGRNYGTALVSIQNHASRQVSVIDLMSQLGLTGPASPDDRLGVYLNANASPVAVQHVLYSANTGFFENMSTCQNSSVSDTNAALMNVHTSVIPDYTSYVAIYNYTSDSTVYDVQVYEAQTGTLKGQVPVTIPANGTFEQPFSWFQDQVQWTPADTEYHANIVAFPEAGTRTALIFHTVFNSRQGVYLNLTNFCTMESTANLLPVANSDTLSGASIGRAFSIPFATLTANDKNTQGASLSDVGTPTTNDSANGTLTQTGNDLVLTAARAGIVTFQYRLRTSAGTSGFATVTVNVSDGVPVTDGDRLPETFLVGSTGNIRIATLIANDHNTDGATLTNVTDPLTDGSVNGTLTSTSTSISYTPARAGTVTFRYQLQNSFGVSNAATVTLTASAGSAPVAVNDTLSQAFTAGQPGNISISGLQSNDQNVTGAVIANVSTPSSDGRANGSFSTAVDTLVYTPDRAGTVTFTYQLRNTAGLSNTATVTLTVGSGANTAAVAVDDALTQSYTAGVQATIPTLYLTVNDRNTTGAAFDNFTAPTTDGAANGTMVRSGDNLLYTPARNGVVTFTYQLRSSSGLSNTATVTLVVGAAAPVAVNDNLTLSFAPGQGTAISTSLLLANDQNAGSATVASIGTPTTNGQTNGAFSTASGGLVYTPDRAGTVTFTYQLRGSSGLSNTATVTLIVSGAATAPTAVDDSLTQTYTVGVQATIPTLYLTVNDRNATGATFDSFSQPVTDGAANGTLTRSGDNLLYTPARQGRVTFTYQLRNSTGLSNTATVGLTVSAAGPSAPPVAVNDTLTQSFTPGQSTSITFTSLMANDQNTTGASFASVGPPTTSGSVNGTFGTSPSNLIYTPDRAGTVTFTYQLRNSAGVSNTATVTLTVTGSTATLTTVEDTLTQLFTPGVQATIPIVYLTANDRNTTGAAFDNFTTPTTDGAANGTMVRSGDNLFYTPARAGVVTFSYQLRNASGLSGAAPVRLVVVAGSGG